MGHGLDDGRRTVDSRRWAVAELSGRTQSEREGERVRLRAQVSGGRLVSRARGSKGARTREGGRRSCVVGASTVGDRGREVGDELTGGVGGTERERRACEGDGADKPGPRDSERERRERRQARPVC
jgi:hypothetical protein